MQPKNDSYKAVFKERKGPKIKDFIIEDIPKKPSTNNSFGNSKPVPSFQVKVNPT